MPSCYASLQPSISLLKNVWMLEQHSFRLSWVAVFSFWDRTAFSPSSVKGEPGTLAAWPSGKLPDQKMAVGSKSGMLTNRGQQKGVWYKASWLPEKRRSRQRRPWHLEHMVILQRAWSSSSTWRKVMLARPTAGCPTTINLAYRPFPERWMGGKRSL